MSVSCGKQHCPCGTGYDYLCVCTQPEGRRRFCPKCGSWLEIENARTVLDAMIESEPEKVEQRVPVLAGQLPLDIE